MSVKVFAKDAGDYASAAIVANAACESECPDEISKPKSTEEVVQVVRTAMELSKRIVVRGGGHSYTCQSTGCGTLMIDMSSVNNVSIVEDDALGVAYLKVGGGAVWQNVIDILKKSEYVTVHGQCRSVGVVGFALHGGVHFGGLSHLYGLGSDHILGLTMVAANGSVIALESLPHHRCSVDGVLISKESCDGIWFAMRGAGSSFGVVTQLKLRLHKRPLVRSAISTLNIHTVQAARFLLAYMQAIPRNISFTVYGLDARFKSFFFILKFMREKWKIFDIASLLGSWSSPSHDPSSSQRLSSSRGKNTTSSERREATDGSTKRSIHFILEASWTVDEAALLDDTIGDRDTVLGFLRGLHNNSKSNNPCAIWIRDTKIMSEDNPHVGQRGVPYHMCELKDWAIVGSSDDPSSEFWSVSNYDDVWGKGHYYAGASIAVDAEDAAAVLGVTLSRIAGVQTKTAIQDFSATGSDETTASSRGRDGEVEVQSSTSLPPCSDCVLVVHRSSGRLTVPRKEVQVDGDQGIRSYDHRHHHITVNTASQLRESRQHSSINPFLSEHVAVWLELDCGHFRRARRTWARCSDWVDDTQRAMDDARRWWTAHSGGVDDNCPAHEESEACNKQKISDSATMSRYRRSFHYPNVPNLATSDWPIQYWGDENFALLKAVKYQWDPNNVFAHKQSVWPSQRSSFSESAAVCNPSSNNDGIGARNDIGGVAQCACGMISLSVDASVFLLPAALVAVFTCVAVVAIRSLVVCCSRRRR